jgi:hypothetical protein
VVDASERSVWFEVNSWFQLELTRQTALFHDNTDLPQLVETSFSSFRISQIFVDSWNFYSSEIPLAWLLLTLPRRNWKCMPTKLCQFLCCLHMTELNHPKEKELSYWCAELKQGPESIHNMVKEGQNKGFLETASLNNQLKNKIK